MSHRALAVVCATVTMLCCRWVVGGDAASAEESGPTLIQQAILHRGDAAIHSGEFKYRLDVIEEVPTKEVIDQRVEQVRAALREQLRLFEKNPDMTARLQKGIDTAPEYVPDQVLQNANLSMRYFYALRGPELGGDRYFEISQFNREKNGFGKGRTLLLRSLGAGKVNSIEFDSGTGMALTGGKKDVYQPSQEPQRLGRLNGLLSHAVSATEPLAIANWINQSTADFKVEKVNGAGDLETFALEFKVRIAGSANVSIKCQIVPGRGFIVPLLQELDAEKVRFEWRCEDYFQPVGSELWFPKTCEFRDHSLSTPEPRLQKYEFEPDGVVLNNDVPDERFRVAIPSGTPIMDAAVGGKAQFVTTQSILVSCDDWGKISQIDGVELAGPGASAAVDITERASNRKWILAINLILVLTFVWLFFRRRGSKRVAMLVLTVSSTTLLGCQAKMNEAAGTNEQAQIDVQPESIELGDVDTSLGSIEFSFTLRNVSERALSVEVHPECGCTVVEKGSFELPAGASARRLVALSLKGRSGPFNNRIHVKWRPVDSQVAMADVVVPVHAHLFDQWHVSPQRLVLRKGGHGSVTISAPADAWKDVLPQAIGSQIEFKQTSVTAKGTWEERTYQVTSVSDGAHHDNKGIGFSRVGAEQSFLVVPVLVK